MDTPPDNEAWRAWYKARTEALERIRAQELAAMTEERAWEIIQSLETAAPPWRDRPDWSGLIEQQRIFAKWWSRKR